MIVRERPHAVAIGLARGSGEALDERPSVASAPVRLVDGELLEEHLAALVRVHQENAAREAGWHVAFVGDEEVMVRPREEVRRRRRVSRLVEQRARVEHARVIAGPEAF